MLDLIEKKVDKIIECVKDDEGSDDVDSENNEDDEV